MTWMVLSTAAAAAPAFVTGVGGCAGDPATTQPTTTAERQDEALRDPMNYKPQVPGPDGADDFGHMDSNGLKKDLNDVFNP
jgi:hypothetical protein